MLIIPAVNETVFQEVADKISRAERFGATWIHLDVTDGQFASPALWNNPEDLVSLKNRNIKIEVHLMIQNPEEVLVHWLSSGVQRIIVHIEALRDFARVHEQCLRAGVELVIALNPDTPAQQFAHTSAAAHVLVLAVPPGRAGQLFREDQLDKIRFLRTQYPDVTLSVDGGVTPDNALQIQAAGADILISASAIWASGNPETAFHHFQQLCAGSN